MSRIVMFVLNPCRTDVRVLREAASLADAGHDVTIIARTDEAYAAGGEIEDRDGVRIVRVPVAEGPLRWLLLARVPSRFARELAAAVRSWAVRPLAGWLRLAGLTALLLGALVLLPVLLAVAVVGAVVLAAGRFMPPTRSMLGIVGWRLRWRYSTLSWAGRAAAAAPDGDRFHAHDLPAMPAAIAACDRLGGLVVYDSHEVFTESGRNAHLPTAVRLEMRRRERQLAARASALVTVNDALAEVLGRALNPSRIVVVRNCPPRFDPPVPPDRRFHAALGLPPSARVVLYHGGLVPERGIEQLLAAVPALPPDTVVVLLGYGPLRDELRQQALAAGPAGRVHVLDAVPPDALLGWVAAADVVVAAIQPTTLNHRLSTPNKLFEALAAGVPVVASDFPAMRAIVLDDPDGPLGAVCDPTDPAAIAAAVGDILALDAAGTADLRARCLRAAHARYSWEAEVARLVALYGELSDRPW